VHQHTDDARAQTGELRAEHEPREAPAASDRQIDFGGLRQGSGFDLLGHFERCGHEADVRERRRTPSRHQRRLLAA
jgi:hypothetical protein